MKVNLVIENNEEVQELINRTEKALVDLKDCLWRLSAMQVDVKADYAKDEAASGN